MEVIEKYARIVIDQKHINVYDVEDIATGKRPSLELDEASGVVYSYITNVEYDKQWSQPDSKWKCPILNIEGWFDDQYYEEAMQDRVIRKTINEIINFDKLSEGFEKAKPLFMAIGLPIVVSDLEEDQFEHLVLNHLDQPIDQNQLDQVHCIALFRSGHPFIFTKKVAK